MKILWSACLFLWLTCFPVSLFGLATPSLHNNAKPIPITVLSGFLGSGKTTLLQHLLHNNQGLRIAIVVNDVASVNIDSKLLSSTTTSSSGNAAAAAGIVELQNGCACCSKSEELLASVAELVTLSDLRGGGDDGSGGGGGAFDHIVVEMSGVADPKSVRAKFQQAILYDMPLMERVRLDTMVTLVDCTTFEDYLQSAKTANPVETPELFYREGEEPSAGVDEDVDDLMMKDLPPGLVDILNRKPIMNEQVEGVAELLISQTEVADLVLLNKIDLAKNEQVLRRIQSIVKAINPRVTVIRTRFGEIDLQKVLGVAKGEGVVLAGLVDDHKDLVAAATAAAGSSNLTTPRKREDTSHIHSNQDHDCSDPKCTDPSHSHSHAHERVCEDSDCTDPSHSHSHSHDHVCNDPNCTEPTHSHDHETTATHAGIGTYVYRARRPFHPARLVSFLKYLPISRGLPESAAAISSSSDALSIDTKTAKTLKQVLRSKGFTWCADSHVAALYWSQAGSNYDLGIVGSWWATLDRSQWPAEAVESILQDFDDINHNEDESSCSTVGDRRQEIVFIGPELGVGTNQQLVRAALDQCLLDDSEWRYYRENRSKRNELKERFQNPFSSKVLTC